MDKHLSYAFAAATAVICMFSMALVYTGATSLLSAVDTTANIAGGLLLVLILVACYILAVLHIKWFKSIIKRKEKEDVEH